MIRRFPDRHFDLDTAVSLHQPFSPVTAAAAARAGLVACKAAREEGQDAEDGESASEAAEAAAVEAAIAAVRRNQANALDLARVNVDHGGSFVGFLIPPGVSPGDSPMLDMLTEAAPPLPQIIEELAAMVGLA
jgi:hypothetical protein